MLPPQSQFSLPMPRYGMRYGSGCPLAARSFCRAVGCAAVRYSSHSEASCGLPDPTFTDRYARLTIAPDALPPVVVVGEAATGPPHVRNPKHLERGDDVIANAACVGDGRVGPTHTPS